MNCFQHRLPKIRKFQHELSIKIIVKVKLNFHQVNIPMGLDVLFCKDLMANVENSPIRIFPPFPKHVTFTPRYGQLVLVNIRWTKL